MVVSHLDLEAFRYLSWVSVYYVPLTLAEAEIHR